MNLPDLNYHHLRYFWAVARAGSIAKACDELHVAQPTISGQLKELEQAVGSPLFVRSGRGLTPTDTGRMVMRYCDAIFALGHELQQALARGLDAAAPLRVGIVDSLPKTVASWLLEPAFSTGGVLRLVEGHPERLLAELAAHDLDLVLSDAACDDDAGRGLHTHPLGDSPIALFAPPSLPGCSGAFPASIDGQPLVLPTASAAFRHELDAWIERSAVHPLVVAEIQDAALLRSLAVARGAIFPGHLALVEEIERATGARLLGTCPGLRQRFWAISAERRLTHPGVLAITQSARKLLRKV